MTRIHFALAASACLALACSPAVRNDGPPSSSGPDTSTVDGYWKSLYTAYCQVQSRCDSHVDQATCMKFLESINSSQGFNDVGTQVAAVKAGKATYNAASGKKCSEEITAALAAMTCADVRVNNGPPGMESADCKAVFTGTVANGAACVVDIECPAGSFCEQAAPGGDSATPAPECAGTCVAGGVKCHDDAQCTDGKVCDSAHCITPVPAGAENQPCGTGQSCASGLFCAYVPSGGYQCQKPAMQGASCSSTDGCVIGTVCAYHGSDSSESSCLPPKSKGEACQYDGECSANFAAFLLCDDTSHTCVEPPTTGPCLRASYCGGDTYCDFSMEIPQCLAKKALGATCRTSLYGNDCVGSWVHCEPASESAPTGVCTTNAVCMP